MSISKTGGFIVLNFSKTIKHSETLGKIGTILKIVQKGGFYKLYCMKIENYAKYVYKRRLIQKYS